ncbi:hypothetical protein [Bifidobacterium avesanii]|uniref:Lipoprotein n=1 Tax=Bifidobacterium avesanii TaxID=1798157 RepID=A0A7K3TEJ6_9BIFI|nr:hypothetical protein [Bifidobacterium avesanii]KAB8295456.1 hypothetical protein DSM100685_0066 [Bifidobacterium avesanii]NEG77462.1 hypothetical protein [Bifidobacterium avesanii]
MKRRYGFTPIRALAAMTCLAYLFGIAACSGEPTAGPSTDGPTAAEPTATAPAPSSSTATPGATATDALDKQTTPAPAPSTSQPSGGPCAAWQGRYLSPSMGASGLTLNADCSVRIEDGTVYAMTDLTADRAPLGTIPAGSASTPYAPGSYVLDLEPTIHGTVNVYALFPAGVSMGFADEDPADLQYDRLISMSGGPYVNVPYDLVHDGTRFHQPQ